MKFLATQPFIRYNHASFGGHDVQQFLKKQEIEVKEVLELDDLEAIVQFVKHGMGVALVPHSGIWTAHTEGLNVLELGENIFYREILAVSRQDSRRIAELNLLRECWEDAQRGVRAAPIIAPIFHYLKPLRFHHAPKFAVGMVQHQVCGRISTLIRLCDNLF